MVMWICAHGLLFSLPVFVPESSTEGGIRAAGSSCLPFTVAHKHSGIFLDRSYLLKMHITQINRSEGFNPDI